MKTKTSDKIPPPNGRIHSHHKLFFCQCLAEFMPVGEVATVSVEKFRDEFREKIAEMGEEGFRKWIYIRIEYYRRHPDAKKWQDLAKTLRKEWLGDIESVSLSNRRVRIEELKKLYLLLDGRLRAGKEAGGKVDAFAMAKLTKEARETLDQISTEVGEKVTRSELTGKNGGPLSVDHTVTADPVLMTLAREIMAKEDGKGGTVVETGNVMR